MIYIKSDNIISPLGFSSLETFSAMKSGKTGIGMVNNTKYYPESFPASMLNDEKLNKKFNEVAHKNKNTNSFTKLEKMLIISIDDALSQTNVDIKSSKTGIILSTTKGNINLLSENKAQFDENRVMLWKLGNVISEFFNNTNKPIVISNACISGILSINTASMYIQAGMYDNVIVVGGDIISKFVVSGFMSFLSLSPTACKPFDKTRDGLSLGEAAGTVILGKASNIEGEKYIFNGGASANDANHISGPSRTGEGSFIAIKKALEEAQISPSQIDHISAHGTATPYNDEMESIALDRHKLLHPELNSIKGYLGHTLGAAGIIETAILLEEMRQNTILATAGFAVSGVSKAINITSKNIKKDLTHCLKMGSGFGGSNAALIISKII